MRNRVLLRFLCLTATLHVAACGRLGYDALMDAARDDGGVFDASASIDGRVRIDGAGADAGDGGGSPDAGGPTGPLTRTFPFSGTKVRLISLAVGAGGRMYAGGMFDGTLDLGDGPMTSVGGPDGWIASFDPSGALVWKVVFGSTLNDEVQGIGLDAAENVFAAGSFGDTVDFGGGPVTALGNDDAMLASYARDGTYRWAFRYGDAATETGYGNDVFNAISVDSAAVAVGGSFRGTVDFGGGPLTNGGTSSAIVAAYRTSDGSHLWSRAWGVTRLNGALAVHLGGADVWVGGEYEGMPDLGDGPQPYRGVQDALLVRADAATGAFAWGRSAGSSGFDWTIAVTADASGNLYGVGFSSGAIDWGRGVLPFAGLQDAFVVSFDRAGALRWARTLGTPGCEHAGGVLATSSRVYVVGSFEGTMDFGAGPITADTWAREAFLATFDSDGTPLDARALGQPGSASAIALRDGFLYLGGHGGTAVACAGGSGTSAEDAWILRLVPP